MPAAPLEVITIELMTAQSGHFFNVTCAVVPEFEHALLTDFYSIQGLTFPHSLKNMATIAFSGTTYNTMVDFVTVRLERCTELVPVHGTPLPIMTAIRNPNPAIQAVAGKGLIRILRKLARDQGA